MRVSSDHGGLLLIIAFLGQKDLIKRVAYLFITRSLIWCKLALRLFLGFSITHLNPYSFFCSVQNRKQQWSVCSFTIKHFYYNKPFVYFHATLYVDHLCYVLSHYTSFHNGQFYHSYVGSGTEQTELSVLDSPSSIYAS